MARIDLRYVQRFRDRHGKLRHYFRKPGCKRVVLPGQAGSSEFLFAYQEAEKATRVAGERNTQPGSISALIVAYYQSSEWKALRPQTQAGSRRILDRFRGTYGNGPAAQFERAHLQRILDKLSDKPWAAKNLLKRLRNVFRFALERNLAVRNPTEGIKVKTKRTEGYRAWIEDDIEKFMAKWPAGSRARLALMLLLYTGQRRSDVVRFGRQHVRDNAISLTQQKGGTSLTIPIHQTLQSELDRLPTDNLAYLMTAQGKPFTAGGFSNWFSDCARDAGLPNHSSPHGLRKAAARRLAEAGCSAMQIAAITGHSSLKEVERYTKSAAQGHLARSAMATLAKAERG